MIRFLAVFALAILTLTNLDAGPLLAAQGPVKMSGSGICHCPGGEFYDRTRSFTPYASVEACLAQGGRHPSRGQGQCGQVSAGSRPAPMVPVAAPVASTPRYDRDLFGGWNDADGDCQNTRHELLAALSTGPVTLTADDCRVVHGRWNDPYTNRIYSNARDLDIDHLVPLAYAWSRGAHRWPAQKRIAFANDPVNLFAVDASANRQKGAAGPTEWMPPNQGFHCQYLLRFIRVAQSYGLEIPANEARQIAVMRSQSCG